MYNVRKYVKEYGSDRGTKSHDPTNAESNIFHKSLQSIGTTILNTT